MLMAVRTPPIGVEIPADASRGGIQRIDRSAGAANKDPPVRDGGVRVGVQRRGKSEGPLHFQVAQISGGESGLGRHFESAC